jgi:hypothetical protein
MNMSPPATPGSIFVMVGLKQYLFCIHFIPTDYIICTLHKGSNTNNAKHFKRLGMT